MKKVLFLFFIVLGTCAVFADEIFSHKTTAQKAASVMPNFESKSCKFSQNKIMTSSSVALKSSGNFKFIKNQGVIFETTCPIHSESSYTASQNKRINNIVKSVVNKNYSYLEKNFDIYYMSNGAGKWMLALRPLQNSPAKEGMKSIQITGETKSNEGIITKMLIETPNASTTINFTDCR